MSLDRSILSCFVRPPKDASRKELENLWQDICHGEVDEFMIDRIDKIDEPFPLLPFFCCLERVKVKWYRWEKASEKKLKMVPCDVHVDYQLQVVELNDALCRNTCLTQHAAQVRFWLYRAMPDPYESDNEKPHHVAHSAQEIDTFLDKHVDRSKMLTMDQLAKALDESDRQMKKMFDT